jgi:hypothetical protein
MVAANEAETGALEEGEAREAQRTIRTNDLRYIASIAHSLPSVTLLLSIVFHQSLQLIGNVRGYLTPQSPAQFLMLSRYS